VKLLQRFRECSFNISSEYKNKKRKKTVIVTLISQPGMGRHIGRGISNSFVRPCAR
jgi:hypothetical protein